MVSGIARGREHTTTAAESRKMAAILQLIGGDEFSRRLCDPLPPVTAGLYYRSLAAGLHDKIMSQGVGVTDSTWEFVTR